MGNVFPKDPLSLARRGPFLLGDRCQASDGLIVMRCRLGAEEDIVTQWSHAGDRRINYLHKTSLEGWGAGAVRMLPFDLPRSVAACLG